MRKVGRCRSLIEEMQRADKCRKMLRVGGWYRSLVERTSDSEKYLQKSLERKVAEIFPEIAAVASASGIYAAGEQIGGKAAGRSCP